MSLLKRVRNTYIWLPAILALSILAGILVDSEYWLLIMVVFLLYSLYTLALNLIMGYTGQFAVSSPAYMAAAAYVSAVLFIQFSFPFWGAVLFALAVVGLASAILGYITLRYTAGIYFAIVTIAIVGITELLIKLPLVSPYTGGVNGLTTNYSLWLGFTRISSYKEWYFFLLAVVGLITLFAYRLINSRTGRAFTALRENEPLARSIGIRPTYYKTLSYVISSLIVGLGGALSAPVFKFISEGDFNIHVGIVHCVILMVGGLGSFLGPFLGSAIFVLVPEFLRPIADLRLAIFGVILIGVMLFMPGGVASFLKRVKKRYLEPKERETLESTLSLASYQGQSEASVSNVNPQNAPFNTPRRGEAILEGKGLCKSFGGLDALLDVDCYLGQSEILGIIGPNGAGKSTLLNILSGFDKPTKGQVFFHGENITRTPAERLAQRGIVRTFQEVSVFPDLTVSQHLMIARHLPARTGLLLDIAGGSRLRQVETASRYEIISLLGMCGLEKQWNTVGKNLSYGEMKKLSMAMALATKPRILFLDEATAGLSAEETESITEVIRRINALGMSLMVVEHNVPFITKIAHRVIALDLGQKIADGSPQDVVKHEKVVSAYLGGENA